MPLASYTPVTGGLVTPRVDMPVANPVIDQIQIAHPKVDLAVADLRFDPFPSMLANVSGARWAVDYHSQVITKDSELSGLQATGSSPFQSYKLIRNMVLRVTSTLAAVQDDTGKTMKVSGTAMVLGYVIPNEGDMFLADVGQQQLALFRVTSTQKKSIFKEATYEIGYDLDTTDAVKIAALGTRVIQTLYYDDNWVQLGKNPVVTADDYQTIQQLRRAYPRIIKEYFARFFSREYSTFVIPHQASAIYDPYLVKFMLSLASSEVVPEYHHVRVFNMDESDAPMARSLWDAVLEQDPLLLNYSFSRVGLINTNLYNTNPYMGGIAFSGAKWVIVPINGHVTADQEAIAAYQPIPQAFSLTPSFADNIPLDANQFVYTENTRNTAIVSSIPAVTVDDYYVLTSLFYSKGNEMSLFERTVWNYLDKQPVDAYQLAELAQRYVKWGVLEQFYYVPILLALMKAKLSGL